jgi:hypothetical protein
MFSFAFRGPGVPQRPPLPLSGWHRLLDFFLLQIQDNEGAVSQSGQWAVRFF